MIFRTKWKSRLVKLVHFFPFSNIYKHLKSCCRHTAHELAQHNQHRVVIQRSFPCSLGLVVNLSLVGTGLEGAFCKLTSIRARSISVFLPVREHLEGIRVCSQDMLFEDPGGSMKTLNYKAFSHFSMATWGNLPLWRYILPPSAGKKGCSASLLLSIEKRNRKIWGRGFQHSLTHLEWLMCLWAGSIDFLIQKIGIWEVIVRFNFDHKKAHNPVPAAWKVRKLFHLCMSMSLSIKLTITDQTNITWS